MLEHSRSLKKYLPWGITVIVSFAAGTALGAGMLILQPTTTPSHNGEGEIREGNSSYPLINPLLECDLGSDRLGVNHPKPKREDVTAVIEKAKQEKQIASASVYYRDLNNGPWMGIDEREKFLPASLLKVPIMMYFYKQAEQNPSLLDRMVMLEGNVTPTEQHFNPRETVKPGTPYRVGDLVERSIRHSDNGAAEALVSIATPFFLDKLLDTLHVSYVADAEGDFITVRDYATFFRVLFNASYLNDEWSNAALDLLTRVEFNQGIPAGLPPSIPVAHKFGEAFRDDTKEKQLHDCGIVYLPNQPYVLCIMTRGTDLDVQAGVIAKISQVVFETVSQP
ncbi:MAG: hypothetical protein RL141_1118 [Candidatus Parcubacteria bacterium]|jgi:beta-lactamase class A